MKVFRAILYYFFGGAMILGIAGPSLAAAPEKDRTSIDGPFYNPVTKSYFQLFKHPKAGGVYSWAQASAKAVRKRHEGQRGRLAIVKDPETLNFIRDKFPRSEDIWIGVRFYCKFSKLLMSDGKLQSPRVSGMWHPRWYRDAERCGAAGYMPIYLTPPTAGGVFWQASGPTKAHSNYLVEFPAAEKLDEVPQVAAEPTDAPQIAAEPKDEPTEDLTDDLTDAEDTL
jgi:hypothetical protein